MRYLTESIAVVHARMHLTGKTGIGEFTAPAKRSTIFSFVVRMSSDGWRCVSAHNTDVIPGMETNVIDEHGQIHPVDYRQQGDGLD